MKKALQPLVNDLKELKTALQTMMPLSASPSEPQLPTSTPMEPIPCYITRCRYYILGVASDFGAKMLSIELHTVQAHQMGTKNHPASRTFDYPKDYPASWLFYYPKTTKTGQKCRDTTPRRRHSQFSGVVDHKELTGKTGLPQVALLRAPGSSGEMHGNHFSLEQAKGLI
jgi:hypothetical protein